MKSLVNLPKVIATVVLAHAVFAPSGLGAESGAAEPLRANVENVEDNRGGFNTGCRVSLTFFGDDLDDIKGVLRVRATKAVDDLGRDLLPTNSAPVRNLPPPRLARIGNMSVPLRAIVALRSPNRRASSITLIEGTVDLFRPTSSNEGVVNVAEPLAAPGVPFRNKTLEKYGVILTYISCGGPPRQFPGHVILGRAAAAGSRR